MYSRDMGEVGGQRECTVGTWVGATVGRGGGWGGRARARRWSRCCFSRTKSAGGWGAGPGARRTLFAKTSSTDYGGPPLAPRAARGARAAPDLKQLLRLVKVFEVVALRHTAPPTLFK